MFRVFFPTFVPLTVSTVSDSDHRQNEVITSMPEEEENEYQGLVVL